MQDNTRNYKNYRMGEIKMRTKTFNITKEELRLLCNPYDKNIDYEYIDSSYYQLYFYDRLGNLIAIHKYKVIGDDKK